MLRVEDLSKTYYPPPWLQRRFVKGASNRPVEVLRNVSFDVAAGEIVGLVGPNGAGKTTLIKTIATLLDPTQGRVTVDGHCTVADAPEVRERLGLVLSDDRALYLRLRGDQNLEFFGVMHGLRRAHARRRAAELMAQMDLARRDKLVYAYSSGMRARLSIARALLHDPPLLVLDEPTRALDPLASVEVQRLLRTIAQRGRAVLLSSHRIDEIENVCDRIVVIAEGELRFVGTPDALAADARFADALQELLIATEQPAGDGEGEW